LLTSFELLNVEQFGSLTEVKLLVEGWRIESAPPWPVRA
jgi:hypothetical protein